MLSNNLSQFMSKSITSLIGVMFTSSHIKNIGKGKIIKAPDSFKPVLRFAVCSDVHLSGEKDQEAAVRFGQLFDDMYAYSACDKNHPTFDAVVVAGDFTGGGADKEYEMFNTIVSEHIRPETQLLPILGNHEFINYRDYDATIGYDVYKKHISEQVDTHFVINGFHFIGISYDNDGKKFAGKLDWLKKQLDEAVKADPTKPVFVYQHPHPFATVYGSINWGTYEVRKVLQKYPQTVNFSGHSHYAPSDPRSVWQGSFTAVGCGSLSAFMGNLNYIEGDKDAPGKSGGFRLVEVDESGCIRMRLYDSVNRTFFENYEYCFSNIFKTTKRDYTWHRQKSLDTKPLFPDNSRIRAEKASDGSVSLKFPNAKGHYNAENYKITVSASGKKVLEKTFISDYVRAVSDGMSINIGNIEKGEYAVKIIPYSPYAKKGSTLKGTITV